MFDHIANLPFRKHYKTKNLEDFLNDDSVFIQQYFEGSEIIFNKVPWHVDDGMPQYTSLYVVRGRFYMEVEGYEVKHFKKGDLMRFDSSILHRAKASPFAICKIKERKRKPSDTELIAWARKIRESL